MSSSRPLRPTLRRALLGAPLWLLGCHAVGFDTDGCLGNREVAPAAPDSGSASHGTMPPAPPPDACAGPSSTVCAEEGLARWSAVTSEAERRDTLTWIADACTRFPGVACALLAELCLAPFPDGGPRLIEPLCAPLDVTGLLAAWCETGAPGACEILEKRTAPQLPEPVQPTGEELDRTAFLAAEAECRGGDSSACIVLESWRAIGLGTTAPDPAALDALESLCLQGHVDACTRVGSFYLEIGTSDRPRSGERARPWLARACAAEDRGACDILQKVDGTYDPDAEDRALAEQRRQANAATQAAAQAANIASAGAATQECLAGSLDACGLALRMGNFAEDVALREVRATLRRACEAGTLAGCQGLANVGDADGIAGACRLGDSVACEQQQKTEPP